MKSKMTRGRDLLQVLWRWHDFFYNVLVDWRYLGFEILDHRSHDELPSMTIRTYSTLTCDL